MFTGIVRELGTLVAVAPTATGVGLEIDGAQTAALTAIGDSVAINGCCLTAVAVDGARMRFDAIPETLSRTSIGRLGNGARINLEPALRAGEPLGGHYVQGHVDGVGTITAIDDAVDGRRMWIEIPDGLSRYIVEKGSVTVDGVSLTVSALAEGAFEVSLIPHTLEVTTLGALAAGAEVNLEVDVLAKYVESLLPRR